MVMLLLGRSESTSETRTMCSTRVYGLSFLLLLAGAACSDSSSSGRDASEYTDAPGHGDARADAGAPRDTGDPGANDAEAGDGTTLDPDAATGDAGLPDPDGGAQDPDGGAPSLDSGMQDPDGGSAPFAF